MCNIENKNNNTNRKKAATNNSITPQIFKTSFMVYASVLSVKIDFPQNSKTAFITPIHEKSEP